MTHTVSNTQSIINNLQDKIKATLSPLFPTDGNYALVDFPNHPNVGDSAIWLGQLAYFNNVHKVKPSYVSDIACFSSDELRHSLPRGTIYIHGGGNFGDLWNMHQDFRKKLLNEFKDYRIIQLPQSIHFTNKENLENSKDYINNHPDFTLIVRDRKSLVIAQEHYTCKTILCPDMAFYLGVLPRPILPKHDIFCLLRTDKEKSDIGEESILQNNKEINISIRDWVDEDPDLYQRIKKETIPLLPFKLGIKSFNKFARREFLYQRVAENHLDRGLTMLSSGKFVITDRLHAHILSLLLDIPHVRLDNNYGKISNLAEQWTKESTISTPCDNMQEAINYYNKHKALYY